MQAAAAQAEDATPAEAINLAAVSLALLRRGMSVARTATALGVHRSTISRWLAKARADELMGRPPKPYEFAPRLDCTCKHNPIKLGSKIVCVNCCVSGWDFHPSMHADPLPLDPTDETPDPDGLRGGL